MKTNNIIKNSHNNNVLFIHLRKGPTCSWSMDLKDTLHFPTRFSSFQSFTNIS